MTGAIIALGLGALAGYPAGSLNSAVLYSRLLGLADPRQAGSGNPGATNMLRLYGKMAGGATLLADFAKGFFPVWIAGLADTALSAEGWLMAGVALGVFLGHLYPLWFGFQGGKGVITAAGALLAISPLLLSAEALVWLGVVAVSRYVSAGSVLAALAAPGLALWLDLPGVMVGLCVVLAALTCWRHRGNVKRLREGEEFKLRLRGGSDGSG